MIDLIRQNAALVQSVARDQLNVEVGFDRDAVVWLDGYITRQHAQGDPDHVDGLVSTLGSFFGECIAQTHGGEWAEDEHGWGIRFNAEHAAYPFVSVAKHLRTGPDASVLRMFDTLSVLLKHAGS